MRRNDDVSLSGRPRPFLAAAVVLAVGSGCGATPAADDEAAPRVASHSSSIAISADGDRVYVVNPDSDSVSVVATGARALRREILLAGQRPAPDPDSGAFTPAVMPRALALAPDGGTLYVTGQRSGRLYAVDPSGRDSVASVVVGSEPVGVVTSADGAAAFVACSQDGTVVRVDTDGLTLAATAEVDPKPWALALCSEQDHLYVSHFLDGRLSVVDPETMEVTDTWTLPPTDPRGDRRLAHGEVRGLYDVAPRPGGDELWVLHALLATDTAQPDLDFESTAYPTLSLVQPDDGTLRDRLSTDAPDVPGTDGAFTDVVSGPRAVAFTADGDFGLVVDVDSEDVLVVDARRRVQVGLLRPLPGHMPEGIVLSPDETTAWVDERNTGDIAVLRVERDAEGISLAVDGDPISRLEQDPMPVSLRQGQQLFYSANSDELPITKNHWIACATCHMESRSDAVTWRFAAGPRDTPSNAGGTLGTGFLLRTADRTNIQQYWHTINEEQGGQFDPDDAAQAKLLDVLADYVEHGIPLPIPPTTDPDLVALGEEVFHRSEVGCASCHSGPRFTDSGTGNPDLDLDGKVVLYDVGTCATSGDFPDVEHTDVDGNPRSACLFDTPSLNGVADSAPYLHDGSAATLRDVLERTRGTMGDISSLSPDEEDALIEYLRSL